MENDLTGHLKEYTRQHVVADGNISQEYEPQKYISLSYKLSAFGHDNIKKIEITLWKDNAVVWAGDLYALLAKLEG